MKIGLIADEFTRVCLELEDGVEIVNLTPNNYMLEVAFKNLDAVLVESAWLGYDATWKGHIASYAQQKKIKHIKLLSKLARYKKTPLVFWNKEDPIGFERFKHQIEYFDVCLTTDVNKLPDYKRRLTAKQKIDVQPFFFQPKLHNSNTVPIDKPLANKVIFCGGYYGQEYPDRAARLDQAVSVIGKEKIVVFDRFKSGLSSWQCYKGGKNLDVRPAFDYTDSKFFYHQGSAHINVNSIDGLRSMFSRRMLELIACNQKVIDLTQNKNKSLLSDFVIQVSNKNEILESLNKDKPNIDFQYLISEFSVNSFIQKLKAII